MSVRPMVPILVRQVLLFHHFKLMYGGNKNSINEVNNL